MEGGMRELKRPEGIFFFLDVVASSTRTFITFHPAISSKRLNDSAPRLKSLTLWLQR